MALKSLLKAQALKKTATPVNRFISVGDYKQNMQITEHIVKKRGKMIQYKATRISRLKIKLVASN